jgi:hypothetical protein
LKDKLVARRLGYELVPLVKHVDTVGEQLVNDLIVGVK